MKKNALNHVLDMFGKSKHVSVEDTKKPTEKKRASKRKAKK